MSNKVEIVGFDEHASHYKRREVTLNEGGLKTYNPTLVAIDEGVNNMELSLTSIDDGVKATLLANLGLGTTNSKVKVDSVDGIAVYADTAPAPTADINTRQGWLHHKLTANTDKFNYYFYGSAGSSRQYTLGEFVGAFATCVIDNYQSHGESVPFINVYTKPTAEDILLGRFYHTKRTFGLGAEGIIVVGENINLYCGVKPVLANTNRYVHLSTTADDGPGLDTEEILYMTLHTDSDSPINTRVLVSTMGYTLGSTPATLINQAVDLVG